MVELGAHRASEPVPEQVSTGAVSGRLGEFPWDQLTQFKARAAQHPDGLVDLSIGTPVDPTPAVVQEALAAAADAPGYPTTIGVEDTRQACLDWLASHGTIGLGLDQVIPLIGSKELVASLALHLGVQAGDLVVYPEVAYPTYAVGARLVGARTMATDSLTAIGPEVPRVLWLNSPSNPSGRVLGIDHLRKVVEWCRDRGTVLVSDECYLECAWEPENAAPVSILHPDVCGGSAEGILAVHSLSKRSNLAGYRCAFIVGDRDLVGELLAVRKNLGLMMPRPQQAAMAAALRDTEHAREQHVRYAARRAALKQALLAAGYTIDHSEASLYLWTTRGPDGPDCWELVSELAEQGILAAPGDFYGPAGRRHVRIAFTATDERIAAAASRLSAVG